MTFKKNLSPRLHHKASLLQCLFALAASWSTFHFPDQPTWALLQLEYCTIQYNAEQYSAVQFSLVQCSTVQVHFQNAVKSDSLTLCLTL